MNILISSGLLALSIILLADSIRQLRPHTKHKKSQTGTKPQPTTRTKGPGVDLRMTDLRNN